MVGVRVKMIPTYISEVYDICFRDRAFMGNNSIAYVKLIEIFAERMFIPDPLVRMRLIGMGKRSDHGRGALYCHPLHIMFHPPDTTHLFSTAGTPGSSMYQQRQRAAMSGAF